MAPSDHTSVTGTLRLDQQDHRSTSSLHRTFQSGLPARTHTTIHTVSEDFLNYKLPLSTQQDFLQGHTQPCTLSVKTSWTINCLSQPSRTSCKDTHNHSHCQWRLLELYTASPNPANISQCCMCTHYFMTLSPARIIQNVLHKVEQISRFHLLSDF